MDLNAKIRSHCQAANTALAYCATEVMYGKMLLEEILGIELPPAVIYEDNTGAIYLAKNQQVGARTKHVDIKRHYTRELIENKKLIVKFTRTDDNLADTFTKNLGNEHYERFEDIIHSGMTPIKLEDAFADRDREDVKQVANIVVEDRGYGFGITTCETRIETRVDKVTVPSGIRDTDPINTTMDPWDLLGQDQEYVDETYSVQGTAYINVTDSGWETVGRTVLAETGYSEYDDRKAVSGNDDEASHTGVGVDLAGLLGKLRLKE